MSEKDSIPDPSEASERFKGRDPSCGEIAEFLYSFAEGELAPAVDAAFRRHVGRCSQCLEFFESYKKATEVGRKALAPQLPAAVRNSVRDFLKKHGVPLKK